MQDKETTLWLSQMSPGIPPLKHFHVNNMGISEKITKEYKYMENGSAF